MTGHDPARQVTVDDLAHTWARTRRAYEIAETHPVGWQHHCTASDMVAMVDETLTFASMVQRYLEQPDPSDVPYWITAQLVSEVLIVKLVRLLARHHNLEYSPPWIRN